MFKRWIMLLILGIVLISIGIMMNSAYKSSHRQQTGQGGQVAVIYVDGVIMGGHRQDGLFGESGNADSIMKQLREAGGDSSVKAILLRINSPGGSVPATQEIAEEIQKVRQKGKPVVCSMGEMAASGGYWLAAATDKIYANPSTLTGSIGVYVPYSNWEELYKKIGITQDKIKSGPHKDILSPDRPITPEERLILQAMVDEMYNQFITVVSEGRHMDAAKVRQLADGRIYTGLQAKNLGLVDEMGNYYDALQATGELGGLGSAPAVKEYGRKSPLEALLSGEGHTLFKQLAFQQLGLPSTRELPVTAPMAVPERW